MRLRLASAAVLALMLCGLTSVGCGKKAAPVSGEVAETPPVMPITTTPVNPIAAPLPATIPVPPQLPVTTTPTPVLPPVVIPTTPAFPQPVATVPPAGIPTTPMPPTVQPLPAAQPPMVLQPPPPPVTAQPPTMPPPKEPTKPKEPEWPTRVNDRDVMAYLKDCLDPDPALREVGLRTLPTFGPSVKKITDKDGKNLFARTVLSRMDFDKEKDTGVRTAAYAVVTVLGFEDDVDIKEAVRHLSTAIDRGITGGSGRQYAVQALAMAGSKGESAITVLVGVPVNDASYETRRCIAFTLARIGLNESTGPNAKALNCLTTQLAADTSAVVRLEAMQSLALLGPPWDGIHTGGDKVPPKLDQKGIAAHVTALKRRLAPAKAADKSPTGLVEKDKQVELWVRFVLMRFDTKEVNDENISAVAKAVSHPDQGARIQALAILGMMSDFGAKKIDDIVKALGDADLLVVQQAINALVGLGHLSKPALPELRKLEQHKDANIKALATQAVKFITEAKSPAEMQKKP
jgi:hypothetical protein